MQSCKVLTPLNGKSPSRKVKTSNGKRVDSPAADAAAERALQQERFQRDIDDTVAQILAEQEASQNVAKELDYEDHHSTTPPKSHRVRRISFFHGNSSHLKIFLENEEAPSIQYLLCGHRASFSIFSHSLFNGSLRIQRKKITDKKEKVII